MCVSREQESSLFTHISICRELNRIETKTDEDGQDEDWKTLVRKVLQRQKKERQQKEEVGVYFVLNT